MTQPSTPPRHAGHLVTAVLVSHDGARWLPEALDGLAAQIYTPDRVVAVDTGSIDESRDLVAAALGTDALRTVARETAFTAAVQAALDEGSSSDGGPEQPAGSPSDEADAPPVEWLWLLHDDCVPDPIALDELLYRVEAAPSVWMAGPKVRAWDGARLLELGLTIDSTGHIDAGVDGVELDQGQRDDVDEVLAVSTAGALVRRDVWERLGGLDPQWATYGDDVDLGWRINAAGGRVVVVPRAVVRHARGLTVGRRASSVLVGAPVVRRRRAGMQVVLSNTSAWLVAPLLVRYVLGGLLRALGLLAVSRRPSRAAAELRAVAGVYAALGVVVSARRRRATTAEVPYRDLRRLMPRAGRRWRSSPFRVGRLGVERVWLSRPTSSFEAGPVSDEAESLSVADDGLMARFFQHPATVMFLAMTLLALIAERHVLSSTLHGGRLLPATNGASDLWSTYLASWHPSSVGSLTPAPPSLGVLAALSTVLFGKVWLVVDVIVLGAVPLSALSAYAGARALTSAVRVRIWAAVVYALLPAVTGAVAGGRLDVLVVAILLPLLLRAGGSAIRAGATRRSYRRCIGTGLLLALVAAFAPIVWVGGVVVIALAIGFLELDARSTRRGLLARVAAGIVVLAVPVVVLVPWSGHLVRTPKLLLAGSGLPEFFTSHRAPATWSLAFLHAGGPSQPPFWIGLPILAAALLGLTRQSRVAAARVGAAMLVLGVALAIAVSRGAGVTVGLPASRHWPGLALLLAGAGALTAALVAAVGVRPALREQNFGWRQPAAVVMVVLAVVSTATLAAHWLVRGAGGPLRGGAPQALPLYTQSELEIPTAPRALVLQSTGAAVSYALIRRARGLRLGDADTLPTGTPSRAAGDLSSAVRDLVAGRPGAGQELAPFDIQYVVVPSGSVARLAPALARTSTLTVVPTPGATVWRSTLPTGELTVLEPSAATTATSGTASSAPVAQVLAAKPGSADVSVPAGPTGRLAVLAEPVGSGWRATVNGHRLVPRTAYGWAQAFELPTGAGRLRISFASGARSDWLVVELVALVLLVGASLPGRRPDDDEDGAL